MGSHITQTRPHDIRELRTALGGFVTGVTIVTTTVEGRPAGFTANSFTSVSLDPPLILACIGKSSSNFENFQKVDRFCVSVLAESQRNVSQQFASKVADRFAGIEWSVGELGNPIIDKSVSWFDCTLNQRIDAGDHLILIGQVHEFGHNIGTPLAYCRGHYVLFELEQRVLGSIHRQTRFGTILETPEGIVFVSDPQSGALALPRATRLGNRKANDGLFKTLSSIGLEFDLEFLFSVWEDDAGDSLGVYYRGTATGEVKPGHGQIIPINAIPIDKLDPHDQRLILRYKQERENSRFSVYNGTETAGSFWEIPSPITNVKTL